MYIQRAHNPHRYIQFNGNRIVVFVTNKKDPPGAVKALGKTLALFISTVGTILLVFWNGFVWAELPTGYQVVAGTANFQSNGGTLTINASNRAIINYHSFNIGSGNTVNINSPLSLHRVTGGIPSQILGKLNSPGQVFLVNPSGIIYGIGSQVNVQSLVASTLDIHDEDFLAGKYQFQRASGVAPAAIVNQGQIQAANSVVLLGGAIRNAGQITAPQVQLAVGDQITYQVSPNIAIDVKVDKSLQDKVAGYQTAIENSGGITGQQVKLQADLARSFYATTVNNSGIITATGLTQNSQGLIVIQGQTDDRTAVVNNSGQLIAQGTASSPNGGLIHLEGDTATNSGQLIASSAAGGKGGSVSMLGDNVLNLANSMIDVSGDQGGGTALIGGDTQGKNPDIRNALFNYMDPTARILANAGTQGNGGKVVLWSDQETVFEGQIQARGGNLGGNGGSVETSSKQILQATGTVDAGASKGQSGHWLLDPNNITIQNSGSDTNINWSGGNPDTGTTTNDSAIVTTGTIDAALNSGTNVTIQTASAGSNTQTGDITIAAGTTISKTSGGSATLTLDAAGSIISNGTSGSPVNISSTNNALNLVLNSDTAVSAAGGAIALNYTNVTTNGGNITMGGGANPATTAAIGTASNMNGVYLNGGSYSAGAGNISIVGNGYNTAASGSMDGIYATGNSQISTTSGNISMTGVGGAGTGSDTGVHIGSSTVTTQNGSINLTGTGGVSSGGASTIVGTSVSGTVSSTGSGTISLTGTGGGGSSWDYGMAVYSSGTVTTKDGNMTLTGTGGTGTGQQNNGVFVQGAVSSTGNGTINVSGTGGNVAGSTNNYGVSFYDGGSMTSQTGNITITGTGGNVATSNNNGINFYSGANNQLTSTGSANITLTGIAGGGGVGINIDGSGGSNILGGSSMTGNLTLITDQKGFNPAYTDLSTAGTLTLKPYTNSKSIGINGGAGTLQASNSSFFSTIDTTSVSPSNVVVGDSSAGTGAVTISNAWDISGYNFPISVYGGSISNGNITMGGKNLLLGVLNGDYTLAAGKSITKSSGGNATLTIDASRSILFNGTSGSTDTISSTSNALNLILNSDTAIAAAGGAIELDYTNITTNGGNITMGGGANPVTTAAIGTASNNNGIYLNNGSLSAGAGNISLIGTGYTNAGSSSLYGVLLSGSAQLSTTSGNITITGTGGTGINSSQGIRTGGSTLITTQTGGITMTGTGGNGSGTGNNGVDIIGQVSSTGIGTINITGTGNGSGGFEYGLVADSNSLVTSKDGNITLTGQGGTTGSGVYVLQGGTVSSTGNAAINITGTGGTGGCGVNVYKAGVITSQTGNINITGNGVSNYGILLNTTAGTGNSQITSTGSANISLSGTASSSSGIGTIGAAGTINILGGNSMTGNLTLTSDKINLDNTYTQLSTAGILTLKPYTNSTTIGLNGGAGTLAASHAGFFNLINTGTVSPSSVVIGNSTAGTGAVTIGNNWDVSGYNFPISVYGGSISNGNITMGGKNLLLGVLNGDYTLAAGTAISKTNGGNANLTIDASRSILFNGTSGSTDTISSTSNALNLVLNSDTAIAAAGGAIELDYTNITSNGGNVTMGSGVNPATTAAIGTSSNVNGIYLDHGSVNAGSGNISLIGTGYNTAASNLNGIKIGTGEQLSTTSGNMTLTGQGGSGTTWNYGVDVTGAGATLSTQTGALTVTGTGGTGTAAQSLSIGISIESGGTIQSTGGSGAGAITINGTGGGGTGYNHGVSFFQNGTVSANAANINITGQGGTGATGSNEGIIMWPNGNVTSSGSGNITMTGIAGVGPNAYGIETGGTPNSTVGGSSMTGNLTLVADTINLANLAMSTAGVLTLKPYTNSTTIGLNGGAGTLSASSAGFFNLINTGTVSPSNVVIGNSTAGTGAVTIANNWDVSGYNFPISVYGGSISNGNITMGGKNLLLGVLNGDYSLAAGNSFTKSSGGNATLTINASRSILFNGTSGSPDSISSTSNALNLILNSDTALAAAGGAIELDYSNITTNGGNVTMGGGANPATTAAIGTSSNNIGVYLNGGSLSAGAGNISLTGTGYTNAGSGSLYGIGLNNSAQISTSSGNLTAIGTGGAGTTRNHGIEINTNSKITTQNGAVSLTGQGGNGSSTLNVGVNLENGGQVTSTGNGTLTLTGTGGQSNAVNNIGVSLWGTNTLVSSANGAVQITGQGGGTASSSFNYGVQISSSSQVVSTGTATLAISGTGGNGTQGDYGIRSSGASITSQTGNINLTGTGGSGASGSNNGIDTNSGELISSTGSANITLTGIAGAGASYGISSGSTGSNILGGNSMTGNLTLVTDTLSLNNTSTQLITAGILTLKPYTNSASIGINGGTGTLQASNSGFFNLIDTTTVSPSRVVVGNSTSGIGAVTIGNNWDVSGYNFPISVYGGSISNGNITMGGKNLLLGVLNGDYSLAAGTSITKSSGGNATLTIDASRSILFNGTSGSSDSISSTSNALNLILNSDTALAAAGGAIELDYTNITSNGGNVTMGGGANPATTAAIGTSANTAGIYLNGGSMSAGTGNVSLIGTGYSTAGLGNLYGVELASGAQVGTTSGNITATGTGGNGISSNHGVYITGNNSLITSQTGTITITGQGGNGLGNTNAGVALDNGGQITGTGSAVLNISGTGGSGNGTNYNFGVDVTGTNSKITGQDGNVTITGQGGNGTSSDYNFGVSVDSGGKINSLGAATLNITGTGGQNGDINNIGVYANSLITSQTGNITINGQGGNGNASSYNNNGLEVDSSGVISSTGSATLNLSGTAQGYGYGVVLWPGGVITGKNGAVTVTGQGGGGANSVNNYGVYVSGGTISSTGSAPLNITGTGGTTFYNNHGIDIDNAGSVITSQTGNVTLTGHGGSGASGNNDGIRLYNGGRVVSTGSANITLDGTPGAAGASYGLQSVTGNNTLGGNSMTGNLTLSADTINLSNLQMSTAGILTLQPHTSSASIGINGGAGTLQVSNSGFLNLIDTTTVSPSDVVIGNSTAGTGAVTIGNNWDIHNYSFPISVYGGSITSGSITGGAQNLLLRSLVTDITINNGASISSTGTGTPLVLAAVRNFINNSGSSALSTPNGRWLVYATDPGNSIPGPLSYTNEFNKTFANNPPSSITDSGNLMLFSMLPTLTVTFNNSSRLYGAPNQFTSTITGFINGDTAATAYSGSAGYSTAATSASPVGAYGVTPTLGSLVSNEGYQFNFVAGTLTITPAPLSIAANNISRLYGASNPVFSALYTGLAANDTPASLSGSLHLDTLATAQSNIGQYSITPSGLTSGNYTITYHPGSLTINPAPLNIRANNVSRAYGVANPPFTLSYSGFVLNQTPGDLNSIITPHTLASTTSHMGQYPITLTGLLRDPNYNIALENGALTVLPSSTFNNFPYLMNSRQSPNTTQPAEYQQEQQTLYQFFDRQTTAQETPNPGTAMSASPKNPVSSVETILTNTNSPTSSAGGMAQTAKTYTVQPGDTLSGIAQKLYGASEPRLIRKIIRMNQLTNPAVLQVNQKLILPSIDR